MPFVVDDILFGLLALGGLAAAVTAATESDGAPGGAGGFDVESCRAAVPSVPGLDPTNTMLGGHFYMGHDPAHLAYLHGYLSDRASSEPDPRSVLAFMALQGREGSTSAINTYDNQIFTYGSGWGGLGGLPHVMERLSQDPTVSGALAACGVWYLGNGQWSVIDDSGSVITGQKDALEVIRGTPALLRLFVHLAEDPETRDAVTDAQLGAWLATSGHVPAGHEIAIQALYNLVTHLQHWAPGYMSGVLESAAAQVPGAPSPARDAQLVRAIVEGFYAHAAGHGWIPSWHQMQGYVLHDMKADGLDVSADPLFSATEPPAATKTAGGCGQNWASMPKYAAGPGSAPAMHTAGGCGPWGAFRPAGMVRAADPFRVEDAVLQTAGGCGQWSYPDPYSVCTTSAPFGDTYMPIDPTPIVGTKVVSGPGHVGPVPPGYEHAYEVAEEPDATPLRQLVRGEATQGHGAGGPGAPIGSGFGELFDPNDPYRAYRRAQGPVAPTADQIAIIKRGIAPAVLAGDNDEIKWCPLRAHEYDLMVTCEPLAVQDLRLPTSMEDAVTVAKAMGALPITPAISDARWAAATQVHAHSFGGKTGAIYNDPAQVVGYNDLIGPNTGDFVDGYFKEIVLVPGLVPSGRGSMAQYGFKNSDGTMFEHGGPSNHDNKYKDYSDTPTYVSRKANKTLPDGSVVQVDLLDELAAGCSLGGPLPAWLVEELRGENA